jgi:DNA-binding transcriptional LysR family regulator
MIDIVEEGFDAGVRQIGHVPQDMIAVPCSAAVRFLVVGTPAYFADHAKPATPEDLRAQTCIRARLPGGAPYKWTFERAGKRVEIDVPGVLTLDAVFHGVGLAWMSEWAVAEHVAAGRVISVLDDWAARAPGLCLYYPGRRHVPAGLRAFIDVIRMCAASDLDTQRFK